MDRKIKLLGPENIEEYLTIYLNAYPAFKSIGDEGRTSKRETVLHSMKNDRDIHFYGLFEDDVLISTMKLVDFSINIFGEMKSAVGLMALAVHPLHKKNKAALDMVSFFEKYTDETGALVSMLLPFNMAFYRKMGYGYGNRLHEYHIPTAGLPVCEKNSMHYITILGSEDVERVLSCHSKCAAAHHGMAEKFSDEIRDIEDDTESRRIGYEENGTLRGYVTFRFICDSDVNYTLNHMDVSEIVYDSPVVFRSLLGFLHLQSDLAQNVVIRTGEDDFCHILTNAQNVTGNYIDFGFLETNISAIGTMYKINDISRFVTGTGHRRFPCDNLTLTLKYRDEMNHDTRSVSVKFTPCGGEAESRWSVLPDDVKTDVTVSGNLSDMSALLMGSCHLSSLVRMGSMNLSDDYFLNRLDTLFHAAEKPFTNSDY